MSTKKQKEDKTSDATPTKIDGSELDKLKKFDMDMRSIIQMLGEASLEKINAEIRLESVAKRITDVETSYTTLLTERDIYTSELTEKYGEGIRIDPTSGDILT
jgi:hypothetical protein